MQCGNTAQWAWGGRFIHHTANGLCKAGNAGSVLVWREMWTQVNCTTPCNFGPPQGGLKWFGYRIWQKWHTNDSVVGGDALSQHPLRTHNLGLCCWGGEGWRWGQDSVLTSVNLELITAGNLMVKPWVQSWQLHLSFEPFISHFKGCDDSDG